MSEYWESRFEKEGAMWKYEPSESALLALKIFKSKKINKILIPGVGYGRNAKIFYGQGFEITGIEISKSAIAIAKQHSLNFRIHHGSVTNMPFDKEKFDGIFCYSLIHLLNRSERKNFLKSCYLQLKTRGLMIFVVVSKNKDIFGSGKILSKDRYEISKGLKVFFYDEKTIKKEFSVFGMLKYNYIFEPIKYMEDQKPIKMIWVLCEKK